MSHLTTKAQGKTVLTDSQTGWQWLLADWLLYQNQWREHYAIGWDTHSGLIQAICPISQLPSQLVDCHAENTSSVRLISPGFINTHTHLSLISPEDDNALNEPGNQVSGKDSFVNWLLAAARMTRQANRPSVAERISQSLKPMLASGVTCINDIASIQECSQVLAHLKASGLRATVNVEFFHPFDPMQPELIDAVAEKMQTLLADWQAHRLLDVGLSPHAPYNVHPEAWRRLRLRFPDLLLHAHFAESSEELTWLQQDQNPFEPLHQKLLNHVFWPHAALRAVADYQANAANALIDWLLRNSLLSKKTVLAHGSFISAEAALYLQERLQASEVPLKVGISHCPQSNLALHGKTLDVRAWQNLGVTLPIALGTDSALSNKDLDLRAEARLAMNLHDWSAQEALMALTVQGARLMGQDSLLGELDIGKAADCCLWQSPFKEWPEGSFVPAEAVLSIKTHLVASFVAGHPIFQPSFKK
ncbi:MAG: amidohydrolase family protein [Vampirovibrionales bacterium]|nr:amidohydrolase family protein [Vampirovibrionales bacterium]